MGFGSENYVLFTRFIKIISLAIFPILVLQRNSVFNTRNVDKVPLFKLKYNVFKNSFSPSTAIEWNNLDPNLQNESGFHIF